ncbi:MAG TPA: hypothetical protein VJ023_07105 [Pyrinomonadaceae bacterium]|nr:hypothetical protein [Pyrinomonadaceae bacterium]
MFRSLSHGNDLDYIVRLRMSHCHDVSLEQSKRYVALLSIIDAIIKDSNRFSCKDPFDPDEVNPVLMQSLFRAAS